MTIPAYPLAWPASWKRTETHRRETARFGRRDYQRSNSYKSLRELSIAEATSRVRAAITAMGIRDDDLVISSNLQLRLDGFPRSGQAEPRDPGVAVYWQKHTQRKDPPKCMAVDRYDRVADNLAAIAATVEAMRAMERHGGAEILERAYTGFTALEGPQSTHWSEVLGVERDASTTQAKAAWHVLRSQHHPDNGGDAEKFDAVNKAWDACCREHEYQDMA